MNASAIYDHPVRWSQLVRWDGQPSASLFDGAQS
jgi:hypothetical protein